MKKILKYLLFAFAVILIGFNVYIAATGQWVVYKVLYYNLAEIDDYKFFPNRTLPSSHKPFGWKTSTHFLKNKLPQEAALMLENLGTTATLIIRNDTILFEQYGEGAIDTTISSSFSMAKSYVSTMIGVALKQGLIKSLDQPIGDFLVEFKAWEKSKITLRHCLTMSSGLDWKEEYLNPFSSVTQAYYGDNIRKQITDLKAIKTPGETFEYKGGDTQILAFVLEKIYGKNLSEITTDLLWNPLGATHHALWSLDRVNGSEKASCCLNATARDFALLGRLYLNKGNWNGQQILDAAYVGLATTPNLLNTKEGTKTDFYGYQWWLLPEYDDEGIYYARGVGGQYIICVPNENMIIVRLGKQRGTKQGSSFEEVFALVDGSKKML